LFLEKNKGDHEYDSEEVVRAAKFAKAKKATTTKNGELTVHAAFLHLPPHGIELLCRGLRGR
jgi:cyanophycinase-like exopeptidase